jgi:hypothetical protein
VKVSEVIVAVLNKASQQLLVNVAAPAGVFKRLAEQHQCMVLVRLRNLFPVFDLGNIEATDVPGDVQMTTCERERLLCMDLRMFLLFDGANRRVLPATL